MEKRYFHSPQKTSLPHDVRARLFVHQNLRNDIRNNCLRDGETLWQAATRLILAGIEAEGHVINSIDQDLVA